MTQVYNAAHFEPGWFAILIVTALFSIGVVMSPSISIALLGQAPKSSDLTQLLLTGAIIAGVVFAAAFGVMFLMFFNLWLRAFVTRAQISLVSLMFMSK